MPWEKGASTHIKYGSTDVETFSKKSMHLKARERTVLLARSIKQYLTHQAENRGDPAQPPVPLCTQFLLHPIPLKFAEYTFLIGKRQQQNAIRRCS